MARPGMHGNVRKTRHAVPGAFRVWLAVIALGAVLLLPNYPGALGVAAFWQLPLELPLAIVALWLLPGGWRPAAAWIVAVAVVLLLFLKLADLATFSALARPFNPVFDLHLLASGWTLLAGAAGGFTAALLAVVAAGVLALGVWSLQRAVHAASFAPTLVRRGGAGTAAVVLGTASVLVAGPLLADRAPGVTLGSSRLVADRAAEIAASRRDLERFRADAGADRFEGAVPDRLLAGLSGKDVLLVFVESYGRTTHANPDFAPTIRARLTGAEQSLAAAGFAMRSGWLTSPVAGGQSWLAHASVLSGLWIDSQRRYQALVTSDRLSLTHLFGRAGWDVVAVMPAITMAWPEGRYFGYDRVHAATGLGYRGEPFNWVTMPDQYTLSAFERLEGEHPSGRPVMAEIALISSHAPWTPVPTVIDWADVGDGTVFTFQARSGPTPREVWRDRRRVRAQFLSAVDYSLETLASYAIEHAGPDTVMIVLGDHQPAPLVTGEGASRDVPVHILSRDPAVIDKIADWGWTPGLLPAGTLAPWKMDAFRNRFVAAFSPGLDVPAPTALARPASAAARPALRRVRFGVSFDGTERPAGEGGER